jgi:hypothetical protein
VADDQARNRVGHDAFEAGADFDADFVLGRRDQQQQAVVALLVADAPGAEQLVGIIVDIVAAERGHGGDDDLPLRLRLKPGQLGGDRGDIGGLQQVRIIDHAPGQLGQIVRACGRQRQHRHHRRHERDQPAHGPRALPPCGQLPCFLVGLSPSKLIVGAVSAPGVVAVNGTIGFAP